MSKEAKAVVRTWFQESDRRKDLPVELCTSDFVGHYPGNPSIDLQSFRPHLKSFYVAFPDLTQTVETMMAEGDRVGFRVVSRGTHTGDFQGIPPTCAKISVTQIGVARVDGGKIAEIWNNPDRLGLMQQLGVIPNATSTESETVAT